MKSRVIPLCIGSFILAACLTWWGLQRSRVANAYKARLSEVRVLLLSGTTLDENGSRFIAIERVCTDSNVVRKIAQLVSKDLNFLAVRKWREGETLSTKQSLTIESIADGKTNRICKITGESLIFIDDAHFFDAGSDIHSLIVDAFRKGVSPAEPQVFRKIDFGW